MSNRIHLLAQQLTGKASVDECSLEEIQHIVKRYPYYASAQFLLLQKLKTISSPTAEDEQNKTVLFYHDPLLFDYFISSDKFYTEEAALFEDSAASEPLTTEYTPEKAQSTPEEVIQSDTASLSTLETSTQPEYEEAVQVTEAIEVLEEPVFTSAENPPLNSTKKEEIENAGVLQSKSTQTEKPALHTQKETTTAADELTFEPYHTVDYFASQGIKISQEEPKDKLGKQLKSFTQWLKTMKRLPAVEQTSAAVETSAEKKIETMANHSVSESDVVTEAMAEVWAKQGNRQKAEETYNKLSLLNPSKRAYFAAKIDNLKQS